MKKASDSRRSSSTRTRPRKKTAGLAPAEAPDSSGGKNVGAMESTLSLAAGVLLVVSALFPRSVRQLFLLAVGGGLVYRGMTSKCGLYEAAGIDTTKDGLLNQINEKFLAS